MSNKNLNFSNLGYTHDELEFLLNKIDKGFVLSEKDYNLLKEIGIENFSTFSGDYNDLENRPVYDDRNTVFAMESFEDSLEDIFISIEIESWRGAIISKISDFVPDIKSVKTGVFISIPSCCISFNNMVFL